MAKKNKKQNIRKSVQTQDELDKLKYKDSFQQFFPIKAVENGFIIDDHGDYFPVLELGTVNLELKTMLEKGDEGKKFERAISSFPFSDFQILIVPMPFDIEEWQKQVGNRLRELSAQRDELSSLLQRERRSDNPDMNRLNELQAQISSISFYENHLSGQNRFVMGRIQSGQVVALKAFFIPRFNEQGNLAYYQNNADTLAKNLAESIPGTHLCNNQEIRNLLFVLLNPLRKDLHKVKPVQLPIAMPQQGGMPQQYQQPRGRYQ